MAVPAWYSNFMKPIDAFTLPYIVSSADRLKASLDGTLGKEVSRMGDAAGFHVLGFQLPQPERPLGPNPGAFGLFGAGGSLGFADPQAGVAFGYVMNRMGPRWQNPTNRNLMDALYSCL